MSAEPQVETRDVYKSAKVDAETCRIFDEQPCGNPKCAMARELVALEPVLQAACAQSDAAAEVRRHPPLSLARAQAYQRVRGANCATDKAVREYRARKDGA